MDNVANGTADAAKVRPPFSIPGKRFTVPLILLILIGIGCVLSIAIRFQVLMNQLDRVRSLWPYAAVQLEQRYQAINAEANEFDSDERDRWTGAYDQFCATSQFDRQSKAAAELEVIIRRSRPHEVILSHGKDLGKDLSAFLAADSARNQLQSDWIGRLTIVSLQLKLPPCFPQWVIKT